MAVTVNNFIQDYTNPTEGTRKTSYKLYLEIRENSYDVETNSSNVDYTAWIIGTSTATTFYGSTMTGTIKQGDKVLAEGSAKATSSKPVSSANKYILASGNDDFKHNDDGTLSITLKFIYSSTANHASAGETTVTLKLTNIPRASTITATNAIIEGTSNIKIDKKSDSFTTTITYAFEGESGTIVTKTNLSEVPWVIPKSFYAKIPSKPYATCTLTATTYSGTTPVGTKPTTLTITADPNKCRPKATIIAVDSNETTKNLTDGTGNVVVIGKSNILCTIEKIVVPNKGADITSVKVNGVELNNLTKVTFNNATTNVFEVIVEDARGYSNKDYNDENKSVTLGKVDYVDVSINATVERNTPTDGKLNIKFDGKYFNGSFGNTDNNLTVQYKYKEKGASEYSNLKDLTYTLKDNTYSGELKEIEGFDYQKEYVVQVIATDLLGSAPKTPIEIPVNKGQPMWWYDQKAFRVLTDFLVKDRNILNDIGTLSGLSTTSKGDLVGAINEVVSSIGNVTDIDSYSFANNGYIRFKNGFQIAWLYLNVTAGGTAWGNVYYSDHAMGNWTKAFTSIYFAKATTNSTTFWCTEASYSNTSGGTVRCFRPNNSTGSIGVRIVGIGKWK